MTRAEWMHAEDDDEPRRPRRRRRAEDAEDEINLVSMIDVFAVLMFFLLVSASINLLRLRTLPLQLPPASATPQPPANTLTVRLQPDALWVSLPGQAARRLARSGNGEELEALSALLLAFKQAAPAERRATLLAAPEMRYDDVVRVMERLRQTPDAARRELFPQIAVGDVEPAA
jgi:biopolymer transport protein ExbD